MNNKDFSMLVIAVLFLAMASGGMNMITGSSSVTSAPGDIIEIPFSFTYDNGWVYGSPNGARVVIDPQWGDSSDEVVWAGSVVDGETYSDSFNYQVPNTEGIYSLIVRYDDQTPSGWTDGSGSFVLTITVETPIYEEPDDPVDPPESETPTDPEEDDGSGVVPDDTPIDQTVEAAILGDSLLDKISVLWDLIVSFFEKLIGAK